MKPWVRVAFWIVVAGQLIFLVGFIGVREASLRTGTEVVLQTVPVDPRSLLQGDYAILDYEIASLRGASRDWPVGQQVYVVLEERRDVWRDVHYRTNRPPSTRVFIRGRVDRPGHVDFGIGTYFLPEGTGRIIENARDVKVVAKISTEGDAVIKDVLVDGRPFDPDSEP